MLFSFSYEMFIYLYQQCSWGNPLLSVFCIFLSSLRKIIQEEDSSLALEISVFMMVLL